MYIHTPESKRRAFLASLNVGNQKRGLRHMNRLFTVKWVDTHVQGGIQKFRLGGANSGFRNVEGQ